VCGLYFRPFQGDLFSPYANGLFTSKQVRKEERKKNPENPKKKKKNKKK
jgi:hypothetical protein